MSQHDHGKVCLKSHTVGGSRTSYGKVRTGPKRGNIRHVKSRINGPGLNRQHGLSLVELMIGLVLGLIVISAVFNTYLGSTRSSRFSEGLQRMQENGRYGIAVLQQGIRLAGYSTTGGLDPFDIAASSENRIVVQMQREFDCNGRDTTPNDGIAINTYAHDAANQLITCTGNIGNEVMPIVEGVDQMRVLWGLDTDDDAVPDRFVTYNPSISNQDVLAMRIALLVNSGESIRTRSGEETHVVLDRVFTTNDRIARNVFSSTVLLRNGELTNIAR